MFEESYCYARVLLLLWCTRHWDLVNRDWRRGHNFGTSIPLELRRAARDRAYFRTSVPLKIRGFVRHRDYIAISTNVRSLWVSMSLIFAELTSIGGFL